MFKIQTVGDTFSNSNLDLVNALLSKFPFSKRINVLVIGKLMAENGFITIRKGESVLHGIASTGSAVLFNR